MNTYLTLLVATSVNAWADKGHNAIMVVAENYLEPSVKSYIAKLLTPFGGRLAAFEQGEDSSAVWADNVRSQNPYKFTSGYHFTNVNMWNKLVDGKWVDGQIDLNNCQYVDERDCPDNQCITGAIGNYTTRAQCGTDGLPVPTFNQTEALLFLNHFAGDISQPLHVCGYKLGGNGNAGPSDLQVTFNGTNLNTYKGRTSPLKFHGMWDFTMIDYYTAIKYQADRDIKNLYKWSDDLIKKLDSGEYASQKDSWVSNVDINARSKVGPSGNSLVGIEWAKDANVINCEMVWGPMVKDPQQDFLKSGYYDAAIPVIEKQIAKAGYRYAKFLNKLFGSCSRSTSTTAPVTTSAATSTGVSVTSTSAAQTTDAATGSAVVTSTTSAYKANPTGTYDKPTSYDKPAGDKPYDGYKADPKEPYGTVSGAYANGFSLVALFTLALAL